MSPIDEYDVLCALPRLFAEVRRLQVEVSALREVEEAAQHLCACSRDCGCVYLGDGETAECARCRLRDALRALDEARAKEGG